MVSLHLQFLWTWILTWVPPLACVLQILLSECTGTPYRYKLPNLWHNLIFFLFLWPSCTLHSRTFWNLYLKNTMKWKVRHSCKLIMSQKYLWLNAVLFLLLRYYFSFLPYYFCFSSTIFCFSSTIFCFSKRNTKIENIFSCQF